MFRMRYYQAQEIAQMETRHSWLAKVMELPQTSWEEAGNRIDAWIEETIKAMYPKADRAGRMVREVYSFLMEKEAVAAWAWENQMWRTVPVLSGVEDAIDVALLEVMYVSEEDIQIATEFLQKMESEELKPNLTEFGLTI